MDAWGAGMVAPFEFELSESSAIIGLFMPISLLRLQQFRFRRSGFRSRVIRMAIAQEFPVRLVCPRCRVPGPDGKLVVSVLEPFEACAGRCRLCGTCYPDIDGVRCVPPDLDSFHKTQPGALGFEWICGNEEDARAASARASQLDPAGAGYSELSFASLHATAHFPAEAGLLRAELDGNRAVPDRVAAWLRLHARRPAVPADCVLEAGCGPGAVLQRVAPLFRAGAVGLDLRLQVLRVARRIADAGEVFLPFCVEGRCFAPVKVRSEAEDRAASGSIHLVQGDIAAPPFEAEVFPAVIALSLLDTVPDPLFAFGQLDALLASGGLLLLGTPYSWDGGVTPPGEWWSGSEQTGAQWVRSTLAGANPVLPHIRYEVLEEADRVPWAVPGHGRLVYRFFLDLLLARKCHPCPTRR
jgi:SAM-dependent methyltransferase